MSNLKRITGNGYKMVVRQSPAQAAEERRALQAAQACDRPIILASRYNFSPSLTFSLHQEHDPILQAAYPVLYKYSYSTFAGYMNPLEIEPLFRDDADVLHRALHFGDPASAMYVIGRHGMLAKVRLFITARSKQVFVQDQEKTIELCEWLKTLPPATVTGSRKWGYKCLADWWAGNEKGKFGIMKLPVELWTEIFELSFGMDIYPCDPASAFRLLDNGERKADKFLAEFGEGYFNDTVRGRMWPNHKYVGTPTRALLKLNKVIFDALLPFVLNKTCKCFHDRDMFLDYLVGWNNHHHPGYPLSVPSNLRILELDLPNDQYFRLFGVQVPPWKESEADLDYLLNRGTHNFFEDLAHLYLRFTVPHDGKADPWFRSGRTLRSDDEYPRDFRGHTSSFDIACQKVVPEMILTAAKRFIQKCPKVTLSGCIKTITKTRFEKLYKEEYESTTGEVHDMTDELAMYKNWDTNDLAPSCHCSKECGRRFFEITHTTVRHNRGNYIPLKFDPEDSGVPHVSWKIKQAEADLETDNGGGDQGSA